MDKKKRLAVQAAAALLQNADFRGFFTGRVSQSPTKAVCVPGLNCYSCPSALGACPLGALQNGLSAYRFRFPYYAVGLLLFFGALLGRLICGFLCPFGLLQDLLHRIPFFKKIKTFRADKYLRFVKYAVLVLLVIVLPLCVKLTPVFCKYLCPSGTLSGLLLAFSDTRLFALFGSRFMGKACILGCVVLTSVILYRPFCKYLCPLGALYALFNRAALIQMTTDRSACVGCGQCAAACDMGVNPAETPNSTECIRCGKCMNVCPAHAIHYTTLLQKNKQTEGKEAVGSKLTQEEKQP